jgi:hypothetical protein
MDNQNPEKEKKEKEKREIYIGRPEKCLKCRDGFINWIPAINDPNNVKIGECGNPTCPSIEYIWLKRTNITHLKCHNL